jgi:hypothetical protein
VLGEDRNEADVASDVSTTKSDPELQTPPFEPAQEAAASLEGNLRLGRWLVRFAIMISTGGLAFVVALPIMRSCSNAEHTATSAGAAAGNDEAPVLAPTAFASPSAAIEGSSVAREVNELPTGVAVAPDKGLVVVKTGGVHSIFVDDEFVGRGPERVVTLNPGVHKVRASLNGEEHTESVNAIAGRAVELSLERTGN